jgi:DegV family protein with EDD domain
MAFVISADTCADLPKSWYEKNGVFYIIMKRVLNGREIAECFDTDAEFDRFYDGLKRGEMPSTVQINPFEYREHFESILKTHPDADIIHLALSSALSATAANGQGLAREMNAELEKAGRKNRIHVVDTLAATLAQGEQIEELVKLRDSGVETAEAIKLIEEFGKGQQGWVIMTDLFHLKRGGRIKPAAAVIGAVLNIRPIVHLAKRGNLAIENKVRGNFKAVKYLLTQIEKRRSGTANTIWVVRTSQSELFDLLKDSIRSAFPELKIRTAIVGPVIGTHLGCGAAAVLFHGSARMDLN